MKNFGIQLSYLLKKVALGAHCEPEEITYLEILDRPNLGSPMRVGNSPIIAINTYAIGKATCYVYLSWQC